MPVLIATISRIVSQDARKPRPEREPAMRVGGAGGSERSSWRRILAPDAPGRGGTARRQNAARAATKGAGRPAPDRRQRARGRTRRSGRSASAHSSRARDQRDADVAAAGIRAVGVARRDSCPAAPSRPARRAAAGRTRRRRSASAPRGRTRHRASRTGRHGGEPRLQRGELGRVLARDWRARAPRRSRRRCWPRRRPATSPSRDRCGRAGTPSPAPRRRRRSPSAGPARSSASTGCRTTTSRGKPSRPERVRRGERAERRPRLVEIDLRIAFVGGDHEAVAIGQLEQARHSSGVVTRPVGLSGEQT